MGGLRDFLRGHHIKLSINPNKEIEIEVHDKSEAFKQMGDIIKKFTH